MFKKIISTLISAGIITAGLVLPVSAATVSVSSITGWEDSFYNTPNSDWTEGKTGIEIVTDSELVGNENASLHLYCEKQLSNLYSRARQTVDGLETGKTYRLTGMVKTSGTGYRYSIRFGDDNTSRKNLNDLDGYIANEWFEFTYDFDYNYNSKIFTIHLEDGGDIYADDLSLKEIVSGEGETAELGEELLVNGDFEAGYETPSDPSFVQAAPANGVNYINVKSELPVNIYQVTSGGNIKLELSEPTLDNEKYNLKVYSHSGLMNGQNYSYIAKSVSDKGIESPGVEVSAVPSEIYDDYVDLTGWVYRNNNNNYGKVTIETGIGIDGSAALRASNMTDSNANSTYLYLKNENGFTLTPGKTYRLSFWEKDGTHNSLSNSMVIRINHSQVSMDEGNTYADANKNIDITMTEADGQWHQRILYLKAEESENTLEFQLNRHYESMIFDDFELYEVDDELEVVSGASNLMADSNCDFEDDFKADIVLSANIVPAMLSLANEDDTDFTANDGVLTSGDVSFFGYTAELTNDGKSRSISYEMVTKDDPAKSQSDQLNTTISDNGAVIIYIISDKELDTEKSTVSID